ILRVDPAPDPLVTADHLPGQRLQAPLEAADQLVARGGVAGPHAVEPLDHLRRLGCRIDHGSLPSTSTLRRPQRIAASGHGITIYHNAGYDRRHPRRKESRNRMSAFAAGSRFPDCGRTSDAIMGRDSEKNRKTVSDFGPDGFLILVGRSI